MIFCGNVGIERLIMHPLNDLDSVHYVDLVMDKEEPKFYVTCCCDEDNEWAFWYSKSNYERVKYAIMDAITMFHTMDEFVEMLEEIFFENFTDILVDECFSDCDGNCDECEFCEE